MKHIRCNSASNKTQQFLFFFFLSFCLPHITSDAAEALTTTVAVGWVGFSSINIAPGISQLLHSLGPNTTLLPSSQLRYRERRCFLLCTEVHTAALQLLEAKT